MTNAAWDAFFVVAFFGGILAGVGALLLLMRRVRPLPTLRSIKCVQCGYDLSGIAAHLPCPECGTTRARMSRIERNRFLKPRVVPVTVAGMVVVVSAFIGLIMLLLIGRAGEIAIALPFIVIGLCTPVGVVAIAARRLMAADAALIAVMGCLFSLVTVFFVFMDEFVWRRPDPLAGLALIGGPVLGGGVSGWGILIAAILIIADRSSRHDRRKHRR